LFFDCAKTPAVGRNPADKNRNQDTKGANFGLSATTTEIDGELIKGGNDVP
jgi:hypothetical protein